MAADLVVIVVTKVFAVDHAEPRHRNLPAVVLDGTGITLEQAGGPGAERGRGRTRTQGNRSH